VILPLKNLRKEDARSELEDETGSMEGVFLDNSVFKVDQSLLGSFDALETRSLKYFRFDLVMRLETTFA
jgi:hypothetical protein